MGGCGCSSFLASTTFISCMNASVSAEATAAAALSAAGIALRRCSKCPIYPHGIPSPPPRPPHASPPLSPPPPPLLRRCSRRATAL